MMQCHALHGNSQGTTAMIRTVIAYDLILHRILEQATGLTF